MRVLAAAQLGAATHELIFYSNDCKNGSGAFQQNRYRIETKKLE